MFIDPPSAAAAAAAAAAATSSSGGKGKATNVEADDDGDDDIAVTGQSGSAAARDMPHPRSMCAKGTPFPEASPTEKQKHVCEQCYCYVCDVKVADCKNWLGHCLADHRVQYWKEKRKVAKAGSTPPPPSAAAAAAAAAAALSCPYAGYHLCHPGCPGYVPPALSAGTSVTSLTHPLHFCLVNSREEPCWWCHGFRKGYPRDCHQCLLSCLVASYLIYDDVRIFR